MKNKKTSKKNDMPVWNLSALYSSPHDPKMEKDMQEIESQFFAFAQKYDVPQKEYLTDSKQLLEALVEYEKIYAHAIPASLMYLFFMKSIDSSNVEVSAKMSLYSERHAKIANAVKFFPINLGTISGENKKKFLNDPALKHFSYFLKSIFDDAKHFLTVPEEKVLSLKRLPSRDMWISQTERMLGSVMLTWKGKKIPLSTAMNQLQDLPTEKLRRKMSEVIYGGLKTLSVPAEGEINALFTDKKIEDELRGFKTPYEETVLEYRNDPQVVETLRKVVTDNFAIAHRFYALKAKMLKEKKLHYYDRGAEIGTNKTKYSFATSLELLKKTFGSIDPKYSVILDSFVKNGQIDALPREGKESGAYCASTFLNHTYVLLNHIDTFDSYSVFAHEMGHAFHGEFSKVQGPILSTYSYSLAETASTLFQTIALEAVFDTLPEKEKVIALHDQINDSISTISRQIACFNFELELHTAIRTKGYVSKEEIAEIHNKNMKAYLGPLFEMKPDDGLMFVSWGHIRRFFYVYSYAYGLLVSKALLRKYKQDKSFWKNIEQFLAAGGKESPENILKEIGIDVSDPNFFREGLREIEDDITRLEQLLTPQKKSKKPARKKSKKK